MFRLPIRMSAAGYRDKNMVNGRFPALFFILLFLLVILSACNQESLTINDVWGRPASAGDNTAAYFVIENNTDRDDFLLSANADVANLVELHRSRMVEGVMKMEPQENIMVPAQGEVVLKPGDYHVMLFDLKDNLGIGDKYSLVLRFQEAGEMTVQVRVMEQ